MKVTSDVSIQLSLTEPLIRKRFSYQIIRLGIYYHIYVIKIIINHPDSKLSLFLSLCEMSKSDLSDYFSKLSLILLVMKFM